MRHNLVVVCYPHAYLRDYLYISHDHDLSRIHRAAPIAVVGSESEISTGPDDRPTSRLEVMQSLWTAMGDMQSCSISERGYQACKWTGCGFRLCLSHGSTCHLRLVSIAR